LADAERLQADEEALGRRSDTSQRVKPPSFLAYGGAVEAAPFQSKAILESKAIPKKLASLLALRCESRGVGPYSVTLSDYIFGRASLL
jgi:hypothetical protein